LSGVIPDILATVFAAARIGRIKAPRGSRGIKATLIKEAPPAYRHHPYQGRAVSFCKAKKKSKVNKLI
jgi:hypothetical protein